MDYDKRQKQLLKKSLRILNSKKGNKICTFIDLIKALKTSAKTFRLYALNTNPEIKDLLAKHRHENPSKNNRKKAVKKRVKIQPKNEENIPAKKEEKLAQKIEPKPIHDNRLRSYEEIKAKLFGYKAFKQKKYNNLTQSAKLLIDRQIQILEWVMKIDAINEQKEG